MKLILVFMLISTGAMAQQRYYHVSGKVIDPETKKGIPGLYVALQGYTVAAFFGDPENFEDLWIDSTDKKGNFHIKAPAKLVDSFIEANSHFLGRYSFAVDVRSGIEPWHYKLYGYKHIIPAIYNIEGTHRMYLNRCIVFLSDINVPIKNDTSGIIVPFYQAGNLQFWLPEQDSAFLNDAYLYVSVQELSATGKVVKHPGTAQCTDECHTGKGLPYGPRYRYVCNH
jgi:hypothetical protein